jgi:hypothetical protein
LNGGGIVGEIEGCEVRTCGKKNGSTVRGFNECSENWLPKSQRELVGGLFGMKKSERDCFVDGAWLGWMEVIG